MPLAGKVEPATIAYHIEPHRADINAFRCGALQSLCKRCHDGLSETGKPRLKQKRIIGLDAIRSAETPIFGRAITAEVVARERA